MEQSLTNNRWAYLTSVTQKKSEIILNISFEHAPADTLTEFQKQIFVSAKLSIENAKDPASVLFTLESIIDDSIDINAVDETTLQINSEHEEIIKINCGNYHFLEIPYSIEDWKNEYFLLRHEMLADRKKSNKDVSEKNTVIEKMKHLLENEKTNSKAKIKYYSELKVLEKVEIIIKQIDLIDRLLNLLND